MEKLWNFVSPKKWEPCNDKVILWVESLTYLPAGVEFKN